MKKIFKFFVEKYLKILTKIVIGRHKPLIVAVAGSTNKTFIKDCILEELKSLKGIRGNPRSFNTEIGLPLAVLFLPSGYSSIFKWVDVLLTGTYLSVFQKKFPRILILEMGVQKKGDMRYLLSIVRPFMAVISDIGKNFFDNKKIIDQEMAHLISAVPKRGRVILNFDQERIRNLKKQAKAPVLFYGTNPKAEIKIKNIQKDLDGQSFDLEQEGKTDYQKTELFGLHNIYALTAAKVVSGEIRKIIKKK